MKPWKKRYWVLLIALVYSIGVGFAVFSKVIQNPDLASSPDVSRNVPTYRKSRIGILEPIEYRVKEARPASVPFGEPIFTPGKADDFVIHWPDDPDVKQKDEAEDWSRHLLGDDALDLVAFATWTPQADDDLTRFKEDPDFRIPLTFREPETLEKIDPDALQIPPELRGLAPPQKYEIPRIRLLFRAPTIEHPRIVEANGGDTGTEARTTFELEELDREIQATNGIGDWIAYDMALLIWHDRPLQVRLNVLTGEPTFAQLPADPKAEVVFGADQLRVQWVSEQLSDLTNNNEINDFKFADGTPEVDWSTLREEQPLWLYHWEREPGDREPDLHSILRISSGNQIKHLGWRHREGHIEWDWGYESGTDEITLRTVPSEEAAQPLELVFVPSQAEVVFDISGLPDLPNPRDIVDLFDATIPRITLPEDEPEERLLQLISIATQQNWDIDELWGDSMPEAMPEDRTFRDTTPQKLLDWYLDHTSTATVEHDEAGLVLNFNQSEGGTWTAIKAWFQTKIEYLGYYF